MVSPRLVKTCKNDPSIFVLPGIVGARVNGRAMAPCIHHGFGSSGGYFPRGTMRIWNRLVGCGDLLLSEDFLSTVKIKCYFIMEKAVLLHNAF